MKCSSTHGSAVRGSQFNDSAKSNNSLVLMDLGSTGSPLKQTTKFVLDGSPALDIDHVKTKRWSSKKNIKLGFQGELSPSISGFGTSASVSNLIELSVEKPIHQFSINLDYLSGQEQIQLKSL